MELVKRYWFYIVLGIVILLFVIGLFQTPEPVSPIIMEETDVVEHNDDITYIYVDLKGAVNLPGVYKIQQSARLFQVVNLAGGLRPDADDNAINLSMILGDQDVIYIPTIDEEYPNITIIEDLDVGNIININTADLEELQRLSGIGPATAQSIIDYREENGSFQSVEDIMNVSGIGESTFEQIKIFITT